MVRRSIGLDDRLQNYLLKASLREPEALQRLREETAAQPNADMQVAPEQGQFLSFLVRLTGARHCLELGTFTGYSALWIALALPSDGRLITCECNAEWAEIAQRHWQEAGVLDKVTLRLGKALDTLDGLIADGGSESIDFAYIDADKKTYGAYYDRVMELLRPGGLAAVDNTLWSGRVADPTVIDRATDAIRTLSARLKDDDRIDLSMLPLADGLTLFRKR